jgi:hypothetical protein
MKPKIILFTLALLAVQTDMAQTNPTSTNSQNVAVIACNAGEYVSSYYNSYQHVVHYSAPPDFINNYTLNWTNGAGGQMVDDYDSWGSSDYGAASWPASSWPQAIPSGSSVEILNGATNWQGTASPLNLSYYEQQHCDADFEMDYAFGIHESYHKVAQTKLTLATGGAPGSTKLNLWVVTANATAEKFVLSSGTFPDDIPVDYGTNSISFKNIYSGVFGQLDDSGHAYMLLPDNTNVDVTPYVPGNDHYAFSDPPAEYPLAITANGITLSNDVVATGADFCVGQGLTFDVVGLNASRHRADDVAAWKLPGTFVNEQPDPNCDFFYDKTNTLLTRYFSTDATLSTPCWYVRDTNQATVSVTVYYDFAAGAGHPVFKETITGKFNVHGPSTDKATPYQPDGNPTPKIAGNTLSLGISGVTNDMSFSHNITADGFTSGQVGYFQLVSGTYSLSSSGLPLHVAPNKGAGTPDTELDNYAPTRGPFSISPNTNSTVVFQDAPHDGLDKNNNAKEDLEFSNYLMFKPAGGIWVPLRLITWELQDESLNLTVQGGATITGDADSTSFPDWKNIFGNYGM